MLEKGRKKKKKENSFFFNDTATTEIYTLSLHDALPNSFVQHATDVVISYTLDQSLPRLQYKNHPERFPFQDRKSTRLNSSHTDIFRMPSSA